MFGKSMSRQFWYHTPRPASTAFKNLWILDMYGVLIPSSWQAMINTFQKHGISVRDDQIRSCVASSKHDHISNIVRNCLPSDSTKVREERVTGILKDFPEYQLDWFQKNPTSSFVIDLPQLKSFLVQEGNALVVTSMFPQKIMDYLACKVYEQGLFPNLLLNSSASMPTRTSLVKMAMNIYPAEHTTFFVDTICDAKEISSNVPEIDVVGVVGYSAEQPFQLAGRFVKEAETTDVIYSMSYAVYKEHGLFEI
jgi:hypothetical protein